METPLARAATRRAAAGRARCDEGMGIDSRDEGFPFPPKSISGKQTGFHAGAESVVHGQVQFLNAMGALGGGAQFHVQQGSHVAAVAAGKAERGAAEEAGDAQGVIDVGRMAGRRSCASQE